MIKIVLHCQKSDEIFILNYLKHNAQCNTNFNSIWENSLTMKDILLF